MWDRQDAGRRHRSTSQREPLDRPCKDGHDTCGCPPMKEICCLTCPLPECLLVLNEGTRSSLPYKEREGTKTETRAVEIVALLATLSPGEIREKLGLSRVQYRRAIVYIQAHTADDFARLMTRLGGERPAPRRRRKPAGHPYKERSGTKTEIRAIAIGPLVGMHTPAEICAKLGLSRAQYQRAILYIKKHAAPELADRVPAILRGDKKTAPAEKREEP